MRANIWRDAIARISAKKRKWISANVFYAGIVRPSLVFYYDSVVR